MSPVASFASLSVFTVSGDSNRINKLDRWPIASTPTFTDDLRDRLPLGPIYPMVGAFLPLWGSDVVPAALSGKRCDHSGTFPSTPYRTVYPCATGVHCTYDAWTSLLLRTIPSTRTRAWLCHLLCDPGPSTRTPWDLHWSDLDRCHFFRKGL